MEDNKLFADFPPVSTEKWEEAIVRDLKGADYKKKLVWKTMEGFEVRPYYRAEDLEGLAYLDSNPGGFPFTRGTRTDNNVWDIRQDIFSDDPAEANRLALEVLNRGVTSIGLCAHRVNSPDEMEVLLKDIDPVAAKINFLSSSDYLQTLQLLVDFAQRHHYDTERIEGSCGFDMFRYALTFGTYQRGEDGDLRMAAEMVRFCRKHLPRMRCLTVHGSLLHNAGGNAVQELGYSLAMGNEMAARLSEMGCGAEDVCRCLVMEMAVGSNYFMEMAKLRATRLLWSKIAEQYAPNEPEACKAFVHAVTSSWNLSVYDPYVNMLRTTTETMSAAIAGADSICTLPFDMAYKAPDEFGYRIARNQQILLKEESYMDKTVDPAAGSYYIENLTDSLAQHAWEEFLAVEKLGGMAKAIGLGYVQDEVEKTAQRRDLDVATRRTTLVGTNQYPNPKERMGEKVMAQVMCRQGCTDGNEVRTLHCHRGAEAFEKLRLQTESCERRPRVFLLTFGDPTMRKARSGFASNFFGVAGYEVVNNLGFESVAEGVDAAIAGKADVVVLCSSDEEYPELTQEACAGLRGKVKAIVMAGNPGEMEDCYRGYGVDEFIHVRTNALECLRAFNKLLIG